MSREKIVRVIRNMPWRGSLMTAGSRAIVPEDSLWKATNMTYDTDGTIQKRPGISNWNTFALKKITPLTGTELWSFSESFNDMDRWVSNVSDIGYIGITGGELQFSIDTNTSGVSKYFAQIVVPSAPMTLKEHSLRFLYQITGLGASGAVLPDTFGWISYPNDTAFGTQFSLYSDGLFYRNNVAAWVLVAGSLFLADGAVHEIEVQCDGAGDVTVYGDGELLDTIAETSFFVAGASGGSQTFQFVFAQDTGRAIYSGRIWDLMWKNGATDPFEAAALKAVTDFDTISDTGEVQRFVVTATTSDLFSDRNFSQAFKRLTPLTYPNTFFTRFRERLIIINHDGGNEGNLYSWDGKFAPEIQEDAPRIRFATEHKTRLWGAGNTKHPLRLYFSGSRQENLWFDPDVDTDETVTELLEAGYLEIPPRGGSEITAVYGDFYDQLIVFTDKGAWRVSGDSPGNFALKANVSGTEGCVGPLALAAVGNDLWFVSTSGVYSLQGTDKFGDIISQSVSAPILNLWSRSKYSGTAANLNALRETSLVYTDRIGQVLMAIPADSSLTANNVYVYSLAVQGWIGPWEADSIGMRNITIGYPIRTNTVVCQTTGHIGYVNPNRRDDASGSFGLELQMPALDGRSLGDPELVGVAKKFSRIRLYFQARGNWDFTTKIFKDGKLLQEVTRKQGQAANFPAVDSTFQVDSPSAGLVTDDEVIVPVEFKLDAVGLNLSLSITTNASDEHLVLQGYEVDIVPAGPVQGVF